MRMLSENISMCCAQWNLQYKVHTRGFTKFVFTNLQISLCSREYAYLLHVHIEYAYLLHVRGKIPSTEIHEFNQSP